MFSLCQSLSKFCVFTHNTVVGLYIHVNLRCYKFTFFNAGVYFFSFSVVVFFSVTTSNPSKLVSN